MNDKILKGIDNNEFTGLILIDLQKAFDTIDHKILLGKLSIMGFSKESISWFRSYLTNRSFLVNVDNAYSSSCEIKCGVPQGSILGPLLFLLYVNDMQQAVKNDLLLYADDSCLAYTNKDVKYIEQKLNKDFNSIVEWLVDNKLSIHLGQDKTKSILFGNKRVMKHQQKLEINYGNVNVKQYDSVKYLGCILDNDLSGESMAKKALSKINGRLKFLYRNQSFLDNSLRRLLANALIQPHFDYACSAWFPNLNKGFSHKILVAQNKCIRFCLNLKNITHIGEKEFKEIKWLPVKQRVYQCINVNIFKYFKGMSPAYSSEMFIAADQRQFTRNSVMKLNLPFRNKNAGQKGISFLGPRIWNELPSHIKLCNSVNTFKHKIKEKYFDNMKKEEADSFIYY